MYKVAWVVVLLIIIIMQQAYHFFNAGKYKQALNTLSANQINLESYQPNLIVCEYMANRCQQSTLNCMRKLNDLHIRKYQRDRLAPQTEATIKVNLAVLLVLQGRRDQALILLNEVYQNRHCFIEFMQSRIYFLLMELNLILKNPLEVLQIDRYYLLRPTEPRGPQPNWISVLQHQHSKMFVVAKQQYNFLRKIMLNQALIALGAPPASLFPAQQQSQLQTQMLSRAQRRKPGISKYYQINVLMMGRFMQAQQALYAKDEGRCMQLMNFTNIQDEVQQMPTTKIVTNCINGFATNNTALALFSQGKYTVALSYFVKARALLSKACTGVQDKELHLFSLNYGSHLQSISYNQLLCLLKQKNKEALPLVEHLKKLNPITKNYKYWYRIAQAYLQAHQDTSIPQQQKTAILHQAMNALNQCWICLQKAQVPQEQQLKKLTKYVQLQQQDLTAIIMRIRSQLQLFRQNTITWLCYASLGLQQYRKTISFAQKALKSQRLQPKNKVNILHYLYEATQALGRQTQATGQLDIIQKQMKQLPKNSSLKTLYVARGKQQMDDLDYQSLFFFHKFRNCLPENIGEAWKYFQMMRAKCHPRVPTALRHAVSFLNSRLQLDRKFMQPYLIAT